MSFDPKLHSQAYGDAFGAPGKSDVMHKLLLGKLWNDDKSGFLCKGVPVGGSCNLDEQCTSTFWDTEEMACNKAVKKEDSGWWLENNVWWLAISVEADHLLCWRGGDVWWRWNVGQWMYVRFPRWQ